MINLFITDFCKWWWLWWILPFLLGWLFAKALCKWKKMYEDLEATIAGYKRNISELEDKLQACMKKRSELESEAALANGRARDAEKALELERSKPKSSGAGVAAASGIAASNIAATPPPAPKAVPKADPKPATNKYAKLKEDNLQIVEGIGPKMNQVLIENGITSWSVLGSKSGPELKAILDKYGDKYRIIDPTEWPAQGKLAGNGDWDGLIAYQKQDGSDSKAEKVMIKLGIIKAWKENDLKAVEGIGPKIEGILNAAGITTWRGLADTSVDKLKTVLAAAGDRYKLADPGTWPKQAEYAANGQWDELEEYQDFLDGGKNPG